MSAIAYTSSPNRHRGQKSAFASSGREIAWLAGAMFAEITPDGFGNGGWVHLFRPHPGVINPIWARSCTHAHELVELHATAERARAA